MVDSESVELGWFDTGELELGEFDPVLVLLGRRGRRVFVMFDKSDTNSREITAV